jgi:hypothetical protein
VFDAAEAIASFSIAARHITLSYVCGDKFLLRNDTPFDLAFLYDVAASGRMYEVRIRGTMPGNDARRNVHRTHVCRA